MLVSQAGSEVCSLPEVESQSWLGAYLDWTPSTAEQPALSSWELMPHSALLGDA